MFVDAADGAAAGDWPESPAVPVVAPAFHGGQMSNKLLQEFGEGVLRAGMAIDRDRLDGSKVAFGSEPQLECLLDGFIRSFCRAGGTDLTGCSDFGTHKPDEAPAF
jgi:hypothetical protein